MGWLSTKIRLQTPFTGYGNSRMADDTKTAQILDEKLAQIEEGRQISNAQSIAKSANLQFSDLSGVPVDPDALKLLSHREAETSMVAPIQTSGKDSVVVIAVDPRTDEAKKSISLLTSKFKEVRVLVVPPTVFSRIMGKYKATLPSDLPQSGSVAINEESIEKFSKDISSLKELQPALGTTTTTELVEVILAGGLAMKASDVHIEPTTENARIRYRMDGVLQDAGTISLEQYQRIVSRIKILTDLKLNITRAAQDGRFTIHNGLVDVEVRVSILPSEYGESCVLRLLDPRTVGVEIGGLGLRKDLSERINLFLKQPQGALLTTWPTGSGKTTTLYAFLGALNSPELKIITIEDPIEYHVAGISQTQVFPDKGYTFASGLRSIVRQDPDVILVGEIRDQETAAIALNASLTGHLVLSTIHTTDAAGVVARLLDMGIQPEAIVSALSLAMSQRLVRKLCEKCKEKKSPSEKEGELIKKAQEVAKKLQISLKDVIYGAKGCNACSQTGYSGRVGVFELIEMTQPIEDLVLARTPTSRIREKAVEDGMVPIMIDATMKVLDGKTSFEEVFRVLGTEE